MLHINWKTFNMLLSSRHPKSSLEIPILPEKKGSDFTENGRTKAQCGNYGKLSHFFGQKFRENNGVLITEK